MYYIHIRVQYNTRDISYEVVVLYYGREYMERLFSSVSTPAFLTFPSIHSGTIIVLNSQLPVSVVAI